MLWTSLGPGFALLRNSGLDPRQLVTGYNPAADLLALANGASTFHEWNYATKMVWGVDLVKAESMIVDQEVRMLKELILESREAKCLE